MVCVRSLANYQILYRKAVPYGVTPKRGEHRRGVGVKYGEHSRAAPGKPTELKLGAALDSVKYSSKGES